MSMEEPPQACVRPVGAPARHPRNRGSVLKNMDKWSKAEGSKGSKEKTVGYSCEVLENKAELTAKGRCFEVSPREYAQYAHLTKAAMKLNPKSLENELTPACQFACNTRAITHQKKMERDLILRLKTLLVEGRSSPFRDALLAMNRRLLKFVADSLVPESALRSNRTLLGLAVAILLRGESEDNQGVIAIFRTMLGMFPHAKTRTDGNAGLMIELAAPGDTLLQNENRKEMIEGFISSASDEDSGPLLLEFLSGSAANYSNVVQEMRLNQIRSVFGRNSIGIDASEVSKRITDGIQIAEGNEESLFEDIAATLGVFDTALFVDAIKHFRRFAVAFNYEPSFGIKYATHALHNIAVKTGRNIEDIRWLKQDLKNTESKYNDTLARTDATEADYKQMVVQSNLKIDTLEKKEGTYRVAEEIFIQYFGDCAAGEYGSSLKEFMQDPAASAAEAYTD